MRSVSPPWPPTRTGCTSRTCRLSSPRTYDLKALSKPSGRFLADRYSF